MNHRKIRKAFRHISPEDAEKIGEIWGAPHKEKIWKRVNEKMNFKEESAMQESTVIKQSKNRKWTGYLGLVAGIALFCGTIAGGMSFLKSRQNLLTEESTIYPSEFSPAESVYSAEEETYPTEPETVPMLAMGVETVTETTTVVIETTAPETAVTTVTETVLKTVRAETTAVPQTEAVLETIPETIPEVPDAGETEDAVNTTAPAEVTASSRSDYAEAYLELCQELNEEDSSLMYDLIDADGRGAPELVVSRVGYAVSLYTYENGKVYTLMDNWGYGVMGNYGYEYIPGQNVFYNHNADYAGLISYDTYMEISADNTLAVIKTVEYQYFDDRNDNDEPDEDEQDSYSNTPYRCFDVTSQNSRFEITVESAELYAQDDFTFLTAEMTYEQITELLNES